MINARGTDLRGGRHSDLTGIVSAQSDEVRELRAGGAGHPGTRSTPSPSRSAARRSQAAATDRPVVRARRTHRARRTRPRGRRSTTLRATRRCPTASNPNRSSSTSRTSRPSSTRCGPAARRAISLQGQRIIVDHRHQVRRQHGGPAGCALLAALRDRGRREPAAACTTPCSPHPRCRTTGRTPTRRTTSAGAWSRSRDSRSRRSGCRLTLDFAKPSRLTVRRPTVAAVIVSVDVVSVDVVSVGVVSVVSVGVVGVVGGGSGPSDTLMTTVLPNGRGVPPVGSWSDYGPLLLVGLDLRRDDGKPVTFENAASQHLLPPYDVRHGDKPGRVEDLDDLEPTGRLSPGRGSVVVTWLRRSVLSGPLQGRR